MATLTPDRITISGGVTSSPGAGANSEQFGAGADAGTGADNIVVGANASLFHAGGGQSAVVGAEAAFYGASSESVLVGYRTSSSSGPDNVLIGHEAMALQSHRVVVSDFSAIQDGATITLTPFTSTGTGTPIVGTEGVDWFNDTSNAACADSIRDWINGLAATTGLECFDQPSQPTIKNIKNTRANNEHNGFLSAVATNAVGGLTLDYGGSSGSSSCVAIGHGARIQPDSFGGGIGAIAIGAGAVSEDASCIAIGRNANSVNQNIVIGANSSTETSSLSRETRPS